MDDLVYNGKVLSWPARKKSWKATSGMDASSETGFVDHRNEKYQKVKDAGPIPEGKYILSLSEEGTAVNFRKSAGGCDLASHRGIQQIPRAATGNASAVCDPYFANWGWNRVRLQPSGNNHNASKFGRSGFYIHDSSKGYSHGCIETEQSFFGELRAESRARAKGKKSMILRLLVDYAAGQSTYGGTKKP
ncbi:MAG: tlde1 domain-containing protein [Phycisphaerae bacterium]